LESYLAELRSCEAEKPGLAAGLFSFPGYSGPCDLTRRPGSFPDATHDPNGTESNAHQAQDKDRGIADVARAVSSTGDAEYASRRDQKASDNDHPGPSQNSRESHRAPFQERPVFLIARFLTER
jgi:hypothetical protein